MPNVISQKALKFSRLVHRLHPQGYKESVWDALRSWTVPAEERLRTSGVAVWLALPEWIAVHEVRKGLKETSSMFAKNIVVLNKDRSASYCRCDFCLQIKSDSGRTKAELDEITGVTRFDLSWSRTPEDLLHLLEPLADYLRRHSSALQDGIPLAAVGPLRL